MAVYKFIEMVGTSSESWEKAAAAAVERASRTLRDVRIAEVSELDMQVHDSRVVAYRAKVKLSFKVETPEDILSGSEVFAEEEEPLTAVA